MGLLKTWKAKESVMLPNEYENRYITLPERLKNCLATKHLKSLYKSALEISKRRHVRYQQMNTC